MTAKIYEKPPSKASFWRIVGYLGSLLKNQKAAFISVLILDVLAWPLDTLLWPFILKWVVDIFIEYDTSRFMAWPVLKTPVLFALGLVIFVEVSSRVMGFLMAEALPKLQKKIRLSFFDHIQRHSPKYFNDKFAGNLSNRLTDMANQVDILINQLFWPIIPALATCIFGAIILGFVRPLFSVILVGWLIVHSCICLFFTRSIEAKEHIHAAARSTLMGRIVDSFTNNFAVNLFYRFSFEQKKIESYQKKEELTNREVKNHIEKMRVVLSFIFFSVVVVGAFGFLLHFWLNDKISTGEVVQVFTTLWSFAMIVWNLGNSLPLIFQSYGVMKQAYEVMLDPQDLGDLTQAKELKISNGAIHFKNVTFGYDQTAFFKNFNLQIKGGEKVGIVGYTGAGKSTLINLLLRFFPLREGEIEIDGQNIQQTTLVSLRRQITLIPQNPILFHRSLSENIAYGKPEATQKEIIQAALSAHCHEFIDQLPNRYEAHVGERGTKLSGGEMQRIAIARSLLINTPILILDEATSALDSLTERYVQDCLEKNMKDKTILAIAHRLSTLNKMDRILVLSHGQIVEEGHPEALKKTGGLFAKMWKMQVGGFLPEKPMAH